MAWTEVSVANTALQRIGISQQITTLADTTSRARAINAVYADVRDRVLTDYPWAFAKRFATLTLVEESAGLAWASQWSRSFRYPTDALMIRRFLTSNGPDDPDPPRFLIGSDDTGGLVYTDVLAADACVEYTLQVTATTYPDEPGSARVFGSALAYLLASEISMALRVDAGLGQANLQMYRLEIETARRLDANEGQGPRYLEDGPFLQARGGS